MPGPVRYPKRFLRGHALVALVRAHKRVHVQGNVDPGADCSVSLIGLEEDDLVFSRDDGGTSYVLRSTQAIIRSFSISKLEVFYSFETDKGNMRKGASGGGKPQPRHVGWDDGRIRVRYNADIRDENTVPVG